METLGGLLRDLSAELAAPFDAIPVPGALAFALRHSRMPSPTPTAASTTGPASSDSPGAAPSVSPPPVTLLRPPAGRTMLLAGPEILRVGAVDGLRDFAAAAHIGVANTWGAKGVLSWESPHHLGTVGLQARDLELLDIAEHDTVWTSGLDPDESPPESLVAAGVAEHRIQAIRPEDLGTLATRVARSSYPITRPPLFERLAAVAQPGYVDERFPRHPARAVIELKQRISGGGVVTAQPGPAGLWVARTFPTDAPGTVIVPARSVPGVGAAVAVALAHQGIPSLVVTVTPIDAITDALVKVAAREGLPLQLEEWGDDVDLSLTRLLVDAAGPVVAWGA